MVVTAVSGVTPDERDAGLAVRRQGYRLHVDARAGLALEQCLPPESFAAFLATCGQASRRLTVMSERLRVLHEQAGDRHPDRRALHALADVNETFMVRSAPRRRYRPGRPAGSPCSATPSMR